MERLTEKHYDGKGYYMVCSGNCANDDEMCGGCPENEKIIDRLGAYEDTGLTPEQVPKWIPVTERLPDSADTVIAVDRDGIMASAYYVGNWHSGGELDEYAVTHWMPLPEPPKGE